MRLYQTPLLIASLLLCIGSASSLSAQRSCPPSYCGDLQIRYPFRLRGDKPTCGDRRYELICDGNRTIIDINSGKYYVKSISYSAGHEHIRITDVGLASGGCALPSNTLSLDTISNDGRFTFSTSLVKDGLYLIEASFVNCTKEIQRRHYPYSYWGDLCPSRSNNFINCTLNRGGSPYMYSHVPCLSGSNASVYVIISAAVGDLAPSCRFLATVTTNTRYPEIAEMDEDVFKDLQNGVSLNWANPSCDPVPYVVKNCFAAVSGVSRFTKRDTRGLKIPNKINQERRLCAS